MSTNDELLREILKRNLLIRVGQHAVFIIKERTARGIFLEGSSDNSGQYSTKPFAMPIGAVKPKKLMFEMLKGKHIDDVQLFKSKNQKLWVVIKNGYRWLKEKAGKHFSSVDLTWTRELMRSLKTTNVNTDTGEITIGHTGARNEMLALYHNVTGAGKGKVKRVYLDLTEEELQEITTEL